MPLTPSGPPSVSPMRKPPDAIPCPNCGHALSIDIEFELVGASAIVSATIVHGCMTVERIAA